MKKAHKHSQEITGTLLRYTTNKHNDIDGFVVDGDGDGTAVEVRFPPHTAKFVRQLAMENDSVNLVLHEKPHPPHAEQKKPNAKLHLLSIENSKTHQHFDVESVKPPHPPETGHLVSFSIPHPQFTRGGKHDDITGVVFEGKFIHLHPDEYGASPAEILAAPTLHVKAKQRTTDAGFINAGGYTVYHAHSITIGEN